MSAPLIISVSGLRGEVGSSLTSDVVTRYALAYSSSLDDPRPFVITRDGRPSGEHFAETLHSSLNASGRSTLDGGIAATPTLGILIREQNAAGGIQISASHNPSEFNGLKLFSQQGRVIPASLGGKILDRYRQLDPNELFAIPKEKEGDRRQLKDTVSAHCRVVLATVDAELIRRSHFRVLLDSNRGAGSLLGRALLESLNCTIVECGMTPDGLFEHTPEPIADNLRSIAQRVRESNVMVGFCQDPDADRLALIDAEGRYPGEEYTVALCAENVLQKQKSPEGSLVINCATSRMSIDIAEKYGVRCFRSPVGEANVVDRMLEEEAIFGGEGNGGPIDPSVGLVRDSFVGMANILEMMARRKQSLASLIAEIPSYSIVKRKRVLESERLAPLFDALESRFPETSVSRQDGLRLDWPDAWVLVRASNTEPIVRIIAESKDVKSADKICDDVESVILSMN